MASVAREIVSFEDDGDRSGRAIRMVDYVGVTVGPKIQRERAAQLTASQKIRRRHHAWMTIIDKEIQTYQEIADDHGCDVSTVYKGVERARGRERKTREAASRYGQ